MTPAVSILIRTRNEGRWLGEVLRRLQSQSFQNFEILIIDSGSTDKTLEVATKFKTKILIIPASKFTYPYALNHGVRNSQGKYIVILSAHSLPFSNKWLETALLHFQNSKVAGVYGGMLALPDGTVWDKLYYGCGFCLEKFVTFPRHYRVVKKAGMGVLGFTNAIVRRDLWDEYNFNEAYANGGEDMDWARYFLDRKFVIVKEMGFSVYHSHGLGLRQWIKQHKYWASTISPAPFRYLGFRTGNTHKQ